MSKFTELQEYGLQLGEWDEDGNYSLWKDYWHFDYRRKGLSFLYESGYNISIWSCPNEYTKEQMEIIVAKVVRIMDSQFKIRDFKFSHHVKDSLERVSSDVWVAIIDPVEI